MTLPLATTAPPAGGAAFHEILIAAGIAGAVILFFAWVVWGERFGKPTFVSRLADWSAQVSGLPRWAALPIALCGISLLSAGFGVWWDVPIHMQNGRDSGPLANPSHYPIFLGILGFTHAGILSIGLARDPLPRHSIRLAPGWRAPLGAFVLTGAGLIALTGFPADDLWHRLFGQDVTEWGPTHVMMIGGAVTCVLGFPLLLAEAAQVGAHGTRGFFGRLAGAVALGICGIPFAFLMEFDLGVPQFPAVTQFIIFAFLATWICCVVRMWLGPGGALLVAGLFLIAHGFLFVSIWLLPDVLTARFLLLVPSAILVELVAAVLPPKAKGRRVPFAVVSGLLVGSLGMYCEWLWSKQFMPLPQPFNSHALPFLLGVSTIAGVGGALMSLWMLARVEAAGSSTPPPAGSPLPMKWMGLAGLAVFVALMAAFAPPRPADHVGGTISYSDVTGGGTECGGDTRCLARVTIRFDEPDAVDDAVWFYSLSWQGNPKGSSADVPRDPGANVPGIVRTELVATGTPGEYRTRDRVPLYGPWKTMLRLHTAPVGMDAIPLYAPDDPAIKGKQGRQVTVADGDHVMSVYEHGFLQRETKEDVPTWLFAAGYGVVIAAWLGLLLFYGWCFNTAARPAEGVDSPAQPEKELV